MIEGKVSAGNPGLARRNRRDGETTPGMIRLSVNVKKVATLRNSRRRRAALGRRRVCASAGGRRARHHVHPRADERHITRPMSRRVAALWRRARRDVEFNMEGGSAAGFPGNGAPGQTPPMHARPVMPGKSPARQGGRPTRPAERPRSSGPAAGACAEHVHRSESAR